MKRLLLSLVATAALALPLAASAAWYGTATLAGTGDADSYGSATISIDNSNLMTVVVNVYNIDPSTTHVDHIHTGTCAAQGAVYIGLANIVTDGAGFGTSTTVVALTAAQLTTVTTTPVYVNVHHQTTFAGITCGNVVIGATPATPGTWGMVKALYR